MKTTHLLFGLLAFIFSNTLLANTITTDATCFKHHLLTNAWQASDGYLWQFNANGSILQMNASTHQLKHGQWLLQSTATGLQLRLKLDDALLHFRLEASCEANAIELLGATPIKLIAKDKRVKKKDALLGDWQEGFHNSTPYLSFAADGSFQHTVTMDGTYELTTGNWTLSKDGTFLFLFDQAGQLLTAFVIDHLQLDELVLTRVNKGGKSHYLNKL